MEGATSRPTRAELFGSDAARATEAPRAEGAEIDGDGNEGALPGANPGLTEILDHETVYAEMQPEREESDLGMSEERMVRVLHGPQNPLKLSGTPEASALYEETSPHGSSGPGSSADWSYITEVQGSVAEPNLLEQPDTESLFIGGRPDIRDIQQGGIGTCYILAALNATTARDPEHILDMVESSGETVVVHFYRYDEASGTWVDAPIAVDRQLIHAVDEEGEIKTIGGARPRIAEQASSSEWFAQVEDETLSVERKDTYEVSLWAPLVEKAYARYAENYGQYGGRRGGPELDDEGAPVSGYEAVSGGVSHRSYYILYGPEVQEVERSAMEYAPDADGVAENTEAIEQLLRGVGVGLEDEETQMVTARVGREDVIERLGASVDEILGDLNAEEYPTFLRELRYLRSLIEHWEGEGGSDALEGVAQAADTLREPDAWPILHSDAADKQFRDLNELLNIAALLGSDSNRGQRFVFAHHVYVVLDLAFRDQDGADIDVTLDTLDAVAARIDPMQSEVTLRNPHGRNAPNERGEKEDQDDADGTFQLTLDQFFRAFGDLDIGAVGA